MNETPASDSGNAPRTDHQEVAGRDLTGRVRELIREGNVREIVVRNSDGDLVAQIPMTAGVVGAVVAPGLAAIGALAALAAKCTITVVRKEPSTDD